MKPATRALRALAVALLAALLLGGCAPKAPDPLSLDESYRSTMDAYLRNLTRGDYASMYAMLDERSKQRTSEEAFVTRHRNIFDGISASDIAYEVLAVEPAPVDASASPAPATPDPALRQVRYRLSMNTSAGPISYEYVAPVRGTAGDEGAAFGVTWSSGMIFPDLGDDDKVRVRTEAGTRGRLLDRNGYVLAGNGTVRTIGLVPGKLGAERDATLAEVAELLGVPVSTLERNLSASWVTDDVFVPVKSISAQDDATRDRLLALPGVLIRESTDRVYPLGASASHLTGYVQSISQEELAAKADQGYKADSRIGKTGLESLYEDRLRGIDGKLIYIEDKYGDQKKILAQIPVKHGEDIRLTIDSPTQSRLYARMGEDCGTAVVLQPRTGEVLALVSAPGFDPNAFVLGLSDAQWQALRDDPDQPLFNRFRASWVPGSCFKPIVAGIGLTSGAFTAEDNFGASGRSWQAQSDWGDYYVTTLADYGDAATLDNALLYSDNIYFAKAALRIGAEPFAQQLQQLGFQQPMPFPFALTPSSVGNQGAIESQIELADSGYGQGRLLVNPVHLAALYTAFCNGGDALAPVLEIADDASPAVYIASAFAPEAAATIRDDLVRVVEHPAGTAHEAFTPGVAIAGKTGTAELKKSKSDTTGTELGWYAAFTADDGPDPVLVVCMIENVKGRGGSKYALRIGQAAFE